MISLVALHGFKAIKFDFSIMGRPTSLSDVYQAKLLTVSRQESNNIVHRHDYSDVYPVVRDYLSTMLTIT